MQQRNRNLYKCTIYGIDKTGSFISTVVINLDLFKRKWQEEKVEVKGCGVVGL